jgi:voltage-gated potassium channel
MSFILPMRYEPLRFLQLALFVLALLFLTAIFPNAVLLRALLALLFLDTLFVSLSAIGVRPRLRATLFGVWLVGTALVLTGGLHMVGRFDRSAVAAGYGAYFFLVASGVATTLRYVLTARRASLDSIFAAVVAYLLMGIGFGVFYSMVLTFDHQAFRGLDRSEFSTHASMESQMIYFSFVTIATLGYGDITPQLPLPRIVAALEAVAGQFYIAIVIAWLVSRYAAEPNR